MVHKPIVNTVRFQRQRLNEDLSAIAPLLNLAAIGTCTADRRLSAAFPKAATVLSVAISYLPSSAASSALGSGCAVAKCAVGSDYHHQLRVVLHAISTLLRIHGAAHADIHIDDIMIDERMNARRAGIGWIGKNGLLQVDGYGSWVCLGEILTDLPCLPDPRSPERRCAGCRRCVEACPVGAITESGVCGDTCVSKLTQSGWPFSAAIAEMMGCNLYGCDVCQDVCPENTRVKPSNPAFLHSVYPPWFADPVQIALISEKVFKADIKNTPIGWIGRNRLRRNAIIALGNAKQASSIPALHQLLQDPSDTIREAAAWALVRIGDFDNNQED